MIRRGVSADIDLINQLGSLVYSNFSKLYNIKDYISNVNYIVLVNESDVVDSFLLVYKNIDFYEIEMLVVDKARRNNGIGSSLLTYFFENHCQPGDIIYLEVACNNEIALNLYKKLGFELLNVRKKYYNNADGYILKKVIN